MLSQETETGRLDWRKAYHELRMEPYEVPPGIASRCREVVARNHLLNEMSVLIEDRDSSRTSFSTDLVKSTHWRVSHEDIAVDIAHVKRS